MLAVIVVLDFFLFMNTYNFIYEYLQYVSKKGFCYKLITFSWDWLRGLRTPNMEDVEHFSCQQQTSGTQKTKANNLPTQKVNNKYSEMTFSRFKVICFLENDSFVSFSWNNYFSLLCAKNGIFLFLSCPLPLFVSLP